jgi:two-component system phosphate regulon sensor histidine kinase PhoR
MMSGWWIAALLFLVLAGLAVANRRLKNQLRQSTGESAHLQAKLSETRQELAEVNARRKKLLSASTQALIIIESNYQISSANKVARQLFGKFEKGSTLMTWTRQHQLQELVKQTLRGNKMPPLYFIWNENNLEAHARFIKEHKKVVAVALAIHDVTELQHLSRARRDFVANISHELRTPLASLQLLTETLLNGALEDKGMAFRLVNKIAAQVDTLGQLAREVLDLSMIESGKVPLKMASYSLQDIVRTQIDDLLPQAARKNITLRAAIDDNVSVLVDETMVGRVLTNLIHNAIKFTEAGGVTVSVSKARGTEGDAEINGEWVTVSVSDTGQGIPPDELPRIFERFYKIDQARDRRDSGTGLGLAIAKHIIEAHSGQIWAESDYGTGATFYFTLPTEEAV